MIIFILQYSGTGMSKILPNTLRSPIKQSFIIKMHKLNSGDTVRKKMKCSRDSEILHGTDWFMILHELVHVLQVFVYSIAN